MKTGIEERYRCVVRFYLKKNHPKTKTKPFLSPKENTVRLLRLSNTDSVCCSSTDWPEAERVC